jgi:hypothetical protein
VFRQNTITGMMCFGLKICGSDFLGYVILFSRLLHRSPLQWTASWSCSYYSSCTCLCGLGRKAVRAISFTFQGGIEFVNCYELVCVCEL